MKEMCDCGKIATWCYTPGFSDGSNSFLCDTCVHRGCTCNEIYVEEDNELPDEDMIEGTDWQWCEVGIKWEHLFEGKKIPCCEYWYNKEGWENDS